MRLFWNYSQIVRRVFFFHGNRLRSVTDSYCIVQFLMLKVNKNFDFKSEKTSYELTPAASRCNPPSRSHTDAIPYTDFHSGTEVHSMTFKLVASSIHCYIKLIQPKTAFVLTLLPGLSLGYMFPWCPGVLNPDPRLIYVTKMMEGNANKNAGGVSM